MESTLDQHQKNISAILHVSTFSKYFFPFGNFIAPLVLWMANRKNSEFIDYNGKQVLNFQISILIYTICLGLLALPFVLLGAWDIFQINNLFEYNTHHIELNSSDFLGFGANWIFIGITGILALGLFILDVVCSIIAALRASEGIEYRYPFSIPFIK